MLVALLFKHPLLLRILYLHLLNDLLLQAAGIAWLMGCLVAGYVYSEVREDEHKGAKPLVKATAGEAKKKST